MTSDIIKFIVYSDIHYDRLGARCITIDDCFKIEKLIQNRIQEGGFDFSIFCGDRFLKRDPEDEVKTKSDASLLGYTNIGDKPHYTLIGNHDWIDNTKGWHTSNSLKYNGLLKSYIMSSPITFEVEGVNAAIHALPSGFKIDMSNYNINEDFLNIFVFHDMIKGCKLDDNGKVVSESGMSLREIDRPEFDVVFGGDIHIPQRLSFKNTQGGYVGAVLQRTRADSNHERGWMEVTAEKVNGKWNLDMYFVPVRSFFIKYNFIVDNNTTYEDIQINEESVEDMCCEIELIGNKEDVDRIANDPRWKNYETFLNIRSINIIRKYNIEQQEVIVDMSNSNTVSSDLSLYLNSGFVNVDGIFKNKLSDIIETLKRS